MSGTIERNNKAHIVATYCRKMRRDIADENLDHLFDLDSDVKLLKYAEREVGSSEVSKLYIESAASKILLKSYFIVILLCVLHLNYNQEILGSATAKGMLRCKSSSNNTPLFSRSRKKCLNGSMREQCHCK